MINCNGFIIVVGIVVVEAAGGHLVILTVVDCVVCLSCRF